MLSFVSNPTIVQDDIPVIWEEEDIASGEVLSTQPYKLSEPSFFKVEPIKAADEGEISSSDDELPPVLAKAEQDSKPSLFEKENYDEETANLFGAAADANMIRIISLVSDGANPATLNPQDQYPLHLWCLRISVTVEPKTRILPGMEALIPNEFKKNIVNQMDCHYCTPLSIMITHDVWAWTVVTGFHNPKHTKPETPDIKRISIRPSCVLRALLEDGGNLLNVRDGYTAFHGIALTMYASKNKAIPGYKENNVLFILPAAVIIRNFRTIGNCDLNARDRHGRTGMDIFIERHRNHDIHLSDADFDVFMDYLDKIGCKRNIY